MMQEQGLGHICEVLVNRGFEAFTKGLGKGGRNRSDTAIVTICTITDTVDDR